MLRMLFAATRGGVIAGALVLFSTLGPSVAMASVPDPLTLVAPRPEQPSYEARAAAFVQAVVPEPFASAYAEAGGIDVLGLPTTRPAPHPNNLDFVYQHFEFGTLFFNASEGTTVVIDSPQL